MATVTQQRADVHRGGPNSHVADEPRYDHFIGGQSEPRGAMARGGR